MAFSDFHCHLAFAADPYRLACDARESGVNLFTVGVQPSEYCNLKTKVSSFDNVAIGLGLHPWWVPANEEELIAVLRYFDALVDPVQQCNPASCVHAKAFCESVGFSACSTLHEQTGLDLSGMSIMQNTIRFIGEVGLDFSPRWEKTRDFQLLALRHIFSVIDTAMPKIVSLHCVKAYDEMLALLEESGITQRHACIFHWFSGSSEHLKKALSLGCYFSVGKHMLASKRGKEYAKAIPASRLLLETDEPFVSVDKKPSAYSGDTIKPVQYGFYELEQSLQASVQILVELKGHSVLEELSNNSKRLFSYRG